MAISDQGLVCERCGKEVQPYDVMYICVGCGYRTRLCICPYAVLAAPEMQSIPWRGWLEEPGCLTVT